MKFTVHKDKWLRGTGYGFLLSHGGKQCCVGFLCEAAGVPRKALLGIGSVTQLSDEYQQMLPEWMRRPSLSGDGYTKIGRIYDTNDARGHLGANREERLTEFFAEQGIEVEFVDGEGP